MTSTPLSPFFDNEVALLKISTYSDLTVVDFQKIFELVKQTTFFLRKSSCVLENLQLLIDIRDWSSLKVRHLELETNSIKAIKEIRNKVRKLKDSNEIELQTIMELKIQIRSIEKDLILFDEFFELEEEVGSLLFGKRLETEIKVVSINYNSPGSIVTEISDVVAKNTSDLLNTILFYSKRKREMELNNELKEIELNEKSRDLENKKRGEMLKSINEDLAHSLMIINQLGDLRDALLRIGATKEESLQFVRTWLLDRIDTIFPAMHKISEITVYKS